MRFTLSSLFKSPKFLFETLSQQDERLEHELEQARFSHALKAGRDGLRRLRDRRFGGNAFDAASASAIITSELQLEGVAFELIVPVSELVVGQYLRSV